MVRELISIAQALRTTDAQTNYIFICLFSDMRLSDATDFGQLYMLRVCRRLNDGRNPNFIFEFYSVACMPT